MRDDVDKPLMVELETMDKAAAHGRNAVSEMSGLMVSMLDDDRVRVRGVSKKLKRVLNSGFDMSPRDMDKLCTEWLRARGRRVKIDRSPQLVKEMRELLRRFERGS